MTKKYFSGFALLTATTLTFTSCTITEKLVTRDNRTDQVQQNPTLTYPVIMDMDIDMSKKIKGTSSGKIAYSMNEDYFKQLALSQALTTSDADLLIEPVFQVTKTYQGKKVTVEVVVTGYPAKYKNPRNLSPADTAMVRFINENIQKSSTTSKTVLPNVMQKPKAKMLGGFPKIY